MIKDGFIPFGPYRTYYRIVGKHSDKAPLLLLHGGPGSTHNYFEALDELAERDQRQLIMYDQIGCGLSSMPDHPQVYQAATWLRELKNLRERRCIWIGSICWASLGAECWQSCIFVMKCRLELRA